MMRASALLRRMTPGLRGCRRLLACVAIALLPWGDAAADAGVYPDHQIRIVASFPPGTAMDIVARIVAIKLAEAVGQPVVVENRPGASGNIGSEYVAKSASDGYTLAIAGVTITMNPGTMGDRAVDPVHAFAPITRLTTQPVVLVAAPSFPPNTLAELLVLARREPNRIAYGTSGVGTPPHLAGALLATRASVELMHIPYAATSQGINGTLSGDVPLAFTFLGVADPMLRSGKVKALAVTGRHRASAFPDIPTVAEQGFPGFDVTSWFGILAPAGTPAAVVERLNREFVRIVNLPDVRAKLVGMGNDVVGNSPEAFAAEIRADVARWGPIMHAAGIRGE
jgi:tripartite-type tricarboxylate transporter receptor subunit TctC